MAAVKYAANYRFVSAEERFKFSSSVIVFIVVFFLFGSAAALKLHFLFQRWEGTIEFPVDKHFCFKLRDCTLSPTLVRGYFED